MTTYIARALGILALGLVPALALAASVSVSTAASNSVIAGTPITFSVVPVDFTGIPTFSVSETYTGSGTSTLSSGDVDGNGDFSWTPQASDVGTHVLIFTVTDPSGNTETVGEHITVNPLPPSVALSAPSPGAAVSAGQTVTFTATTTGFSNPSYFVSDSWGGDISDANIAGGTFSWTPTAFNAGTHVITVIAGDLFGHNASATTTITVNVATSTAPSTTAAAAPAAAISSGLSAQQVSAIIALLQSFGVDQGTISSVSAILNGEPAPASAPASADGYIFNTYLDVGSTGTDVTELQMRLQALGYFNGDPTGYYGSVTQAAVEQFQSANGIEAAGSVGPQTRAALNAQ